jgi:hypothetical protein
MLMLDVLLKAEKNPRLWYLWHLNFIFSQNIISICKELFSDQTDPRLRYLVEGVHCYVKVVDRGVGSHCPHVSLGYYILVWSLGSLGKQGAKYN